MAGIGGNALDRDLAATYIIKAESAIDDVCFSCTTAAKKVYTINEGYAGASSGDWVTRAYATYLTAIKNLSVNIGKNLYDLHQKLLNIVNSGADSDRQNVTIDYHIATGMVQDGDGSYGGLIFNKQMAGIRDFETTLSDVSNFNSAVQALVSSTDQLILQYKGLWQLGDICNNQVLKEASHEAAETVRAYVNSFSQQMTNANQQFMSAIKNQVEYHTTANQEVISAIDSLQASFNNVDFNTLA